MKSLSAIRYSEDSPEACGVSVEPVTEQPSSQSTRRALLSNAVRISPDLFPGVARSVAVALDKLRPESTIEAYVASSETPNAYCMSLDGSVGAVIVLTSGMIELLSEVELPFVIGHEIGPHLLGHARHPAPDPQMSEQERLNVLKLNRAAEISADRLALVCSPSLEDAFRSMLKTASGLSDRHLRVDLTAYLSQLRELRDLSGDPDAAYSSHPIFALRVRALLWFSMSEPYYYWTDNPKQAPISKEQLDERVKADLRSIEGVGLDSIGTAALRGIRIWSSVKLLCSDARLTKAEQKLLARAIGREEADKAVRLLQSQGRSAPALIERKLGEALEGAALLPEEHRLDLLGELERLATASSADPDLLRKTRDQIAEALGL